MHFKQNRPQILIDENSEVIQLQSLNRSLLTVYSLFNQALVEQEAQQAKELNFPPNLHYRIAQ